MVVVSIQELILEAKTNEKISFITYYYYNFFIHFGLQIFQRCLTNISIWLNVQRFLIQRHESSKKSANLILPFKENRRKRTDYPGVRVL